MAAPTRAQPLLRWANVPEQIGPKFEGDCCAPFRGVELWSWVPIQHNVAWDETYLCTKWHLDPSNRLHGHNTPTLQTDRQTRQRPRSIGRTVTCNGRSPPKKHRMARCVHLQQQWRNMSWQNVYAHDRHSISQWWHQWVSQKNTPVWYLSISDAVNEAYTVLIWFCLPRTVPVRHNGSLASLSFSWTVLQCSGRFRLST